MMRPALPLLLAASVLLCGCLEESVPFHPMDAAQLDAQSAYDRVERFALLGPKSTTSPEALKAAQWIRDELSALGLEARLDPFEAETPHGPASFQNVVATLPGTTRDLLILGSHYDTKSGVGDQFVGANDSASSTGLLIELARFFQTQYRSGPEIRFVFFDGEEALVEYGPKDGLQGSRYYAQSLVDAKEQDRVRAVIVLDMIGDKDLHVTIPRNSNAKLVSLAFSSAAKQGVREKFTLFKFNIGDDHVPFINRGMPAIDLIDFQYGTAPGRHDLWHTENDTMEHISADSLSTVGRTTIEMVNELARQSVTGE